MRLIGKLPEAEPAARFVDYLLTIGIPARVDEDQGEWLIWGLEEDQFNEGRKEFQEFRAAPDHAKYQGAGAEAKRIREEERRRLAEIDRNYQDIRRQWQPTVGGAARRTPITVAMIGVCIVVAVWTGLGKYRQNSDHFYWVSARHLAERDWNPRDPADAMVDIQAGEVWRIFAPMFLHLGPLHLLFNMMWLYTLGGQIEARKGKLKFLLLIIATEAVSGFAQAVVMRSPFFGGMSGVVYGLFGYVWMKSRYDPNDGLYIDKNTVNLMVIWFIICFLPGTGVANGGHAGGLVVGGLIGYLSSLRK